MRTCWIRRPSAAGLVLLAMTITAVSDANPLTNSDIVVTATRTYRERMEVPAAVSVISSDRIESSAARNVDDLLRPVPGVAIAPPLGISQGMPVQTQVRGVPGHGRVLLLLDGMPLNEAYSHFPAMNEAPLAAIDRIEVIRGPFSSLYGSDAFGGVFNVITRTADNGPSTDISVAGGDYGFREFNLSECGSEGSLDYLIAATWRTIENYLTRDHEISHEYDWATGQYVDGIIDPLNRDYTDTALLTRLGFDLGTDSRLTLHGRYFTGELGYGQKTIPQIHPAPEDNTTKTRTGMVGADLATTLSPRVDLRVSTYYRNQNRRLWGLDYSHMDGELPVYARSISKTDTDECKLDAGADIEAADGHIFSVGTEGLWTRANFLPLSGVADGQPLPGAEGADESVWNAALYAQYEGSFLHNRLKLVPGVRLDHNSEFGNVVSPRAGAMAKLSDSVSLRGSMGRAYRAPTMVELYQPPISFGSLTFMSNPNLNPEYISAGDVGLELRPHERVSARITWFYNDMHDLIEDVQAGDVMSNANIDKAFSRGVEADMDLRICDTWSATAAGTWQTAKNEATGGKLDYMPDRLASLGLHRTVNAGKWKVTGGVDETYVGERGFTDWASGQWLTVDGYWRTDAALRGTYDDSYKIGISAQNLADAEYQESRMSILAPGRLVVLEAGMLF